MVFIVSVVVVVLCSSISDAQNVFAKEERFQMRACEIHVRKAYFRERRQRGFYARRQRVYAYPKSSLANTVCPNLPPLTRGSRTFWVPAGGFRPRYYRYIPPRWSSLIVSHTVLPRPVCEVAFATPRENPSVSSLCENCIIPFVLCTEKSERSRSSGTARYETSDWSGLAV